MDGLVKDHGVANTYFDNLGGGWRMDCRCGFTTDPEDCVEYAGAQMDDHFNEISEEREA